MDAVLFFIARILVGLLQRLPLLWVARLGRVAGALAYAIDRRHRRVALRNITLCFASEKSPAEIRDIARENFRRIGENFACAVKTASMSHDELRPHIEFVASREFNDRAKGRVVVAIGHFGNFELYARFGQVMPAIQCATTYRGLRQPSLNRLMQSLREKSGCHFFERRFDGQALKEFMHGEGIILGLLADQHAGRNGLWLPFLGHDCSTTASPAVFALRYNCALYTAICYRIAPARWRVEAGAEIATRVDERNRTPLEIMAEVNRAFDDAVRRDPANWFWVHKRWKPETSLRRAPAEAAAETSIATA